MTRIYRHPTQPNVDVPQLDLLSLLFDSEHSLAQDDTVLHVEAANHSNGVTKAQLRDLTERIAHSLRHSYGIGANGPNKDVVTVISCGQVLLPAVFCGIIAAGGVYSAASPSSMTSEVIRQVRIGNSRLIICGSEHKDVASRAAEECGVPAANVVVLESSPTWNLTRSDGLSLLSNQRLWWQRITDPQLLKESLILILWSSGTTGLPKGVMLSHANLVTQTYVLSLSGRQWAEQEIAKGNQLPVVEYRTLAHLPTSHIAGLIGYLIFPLYSGCIVVWMRKYNFHDMLRYLKQYKITAFYTVPSIYLRISKSPEVTDHFQHLVAASTGAASMDGQLQMAANSRLGDGKADIIGQTWGLSETTGAVTAMPKGETDRTGSISPLLPTVELRMVDEEFLDVEPGEPGEMLLRGPLVTNGYFNNPKATKDAFHDSWFCTGDIGVLRDGKFYIVDRKKEILKYKGLQIAPAEIENMLFTHPQVVEAAVVGIPVPDDPSSEWPRAYVVALDRRDLMEVDVKQYVQDRLAPHKQLRGGVVFVDEIPKNAVGKFLRRELRDRARRELGRTSKL